MAPSNTVEVTLGMKHKAFNKLVHNAITSQETLDKKLFAADELDMDNLIKIDIASHNRDINYIMSVLKCEDMLYVSRAIKQSTWLVDDQYAHMINPEYLNEHIFPSMQTKAIIKLLKHIRHYLKTESRAEQFYQNEKRLKTAVKWLSRCSIAFIENNIGKHMQHITVLEFKRLCERSVTVFEVATKDYVSCINLEAASFLLHDHADKYLDVIDKAHRLSRPRFSPAATELIMKKTPDRIKNNFLKYLDNIHMPTFINSIKREEIKEFLFKLANNEVKGLDEHYYRSFFRFNVIKQFVKRMPKEEQFEFVKKVFLDKENIVKIEDASLKRGTEMFAIKEICLTVGTSMPIYHWYEFAPFNVAFEEIKKLMQSETNINETYSMLNVLLNCAGANTKDLLALLDYYFKNNLNDDVGRKKNFTNNLILRAEIYKKDNVTWKAFIDIISNLNIYTENNNQEYVEITILYNVLHEKQVSEMIEKSFTFNTLKSYREKLNLDEQNKVFKYLYNHMMKKLESHNIRSEVEFTEAIQILDKLLNVLLDWDKKLADYPYALNKIRNLIQIRKEHGWKISLSSLYNKKKPWRRLMFEESVVLNPTQDVFINALKHDPELLVRYKSDVEAISCDDTISLKQLLRKLRIYWPKSLADNWTKSYQSRLDKLGGHKALIRGLCTLLPREQLIPIIEKYAPTQPKIDWNNTNELTLGLQRCIAKNMHITRPQISADTVLLYAKGDFLQYSLPSVLAIYYNMARSQSEENIRKLLNSPVSLQKHGLRFAFIKLKHEELKHHLSNIWQTSKNITIRAVSFVLLFDLMCKEKDVVRAKELWEILEVFIDNLSFKEDKKIYEKLPKVQEVPEKIQPGFLVKSYKFLKSLLPHLKNDRRNYEYHIEQLVCHTRNIMEFMCPNFVTEIITEYFDANFFNSEIQNLNSGILAVFSSYLLCAKDEETQTNKYKIVLEPLVKRALNQWNDLSKKGEYFVRCHFQELLNHLSQDLCQYVYDNKMIIPTKMFIEINKQLNEALDVPQNYIMLRMWKLTVKMAEIIENSGKKDDWRESPEIAFEYGKFCLEVLKEDVKLYFPCIYVLYAKVLRKTVQQFFPDIISRQIYAIMLSEEDFIQAFLLILKMLPTGRCYYSDEKIGEKEQEIRKIIREHPTVEVKMHYYCKYHYENEAESLGI